MPEVSVVVISKDEPELDATLSSLRPQVEAADAECLVVDASEGRLDAVRDAHQWVRWIPFELPEGRRVGIPHQRNVGVRESTGRVVAFCDAHGTPSATWLKHLTEPVLDDCCEAATGPITPVEPGAYGVLNDFEDGSFTSRVITANFAVSRAAFDRVSGFDERYDYGSDANFGWRLEEQGIGVLVVRDAVMAMDWGDAARERRRAWVQGRAWAQQVRLNQGRRYQTIRAAPYTLLFGAVGGVGLVALLVALRRRSVVPIGAWSALVAALVTALPKGRRRRVATYHVLHGISSVLDTSRAVLGHARDDRARRP